jgi:hypothetical protein
LVDFVRVFTGGWDNMRIPGEGERDSGIKPNGIPG